MRAEGRIWNYARDVIEKPDEGSLLLTLAPDHDSRAVHHVAQPRLAGMLYASDGGPCWPAPRTSFPSPRPFPRQPLPWPARQRRAHRAGHGARREGFATRLSRTLLRSRAIRRWPAAAQGPRGSGGEADTVRHHGPVVGALRDAYENLENGCILVHGGVRARSGR